MTLWLKKYGIAVAFTLVIVGVVTWVTVGMLSKPDRESPAPDTALVNEVESEFTVEPKAEVTVEVGE